MNNSTLRIINGLGAISLIILLFFASSNKWATILSLIGVSINLFYLYKKKSIHNENKSVD